MSEGNKEINVQSQCYSNVYDFNHIYHILVFDRHALSKPLIFLLAYSSLFDYNKEQITNIIRRNAIK